MSDIVQSSGTSGDHKDGDNEAFMEEQEVPAAVQAAPQKEADSPGVAAPVEQQDMQPCGDEVAEGQDVAAGVHVQGLQLDGHQQVTAKLSNVNVKKPTTPLLFEHLLPKRDTKTGEKQGTAKGPTSQLLNKLLMKPVEPTGPDAIDNFIRLNPGICSETPQQTESRRRNRSDANNEQPGPSSKKQCPDGKFD